SQPHRHGRGRSRPIRPLHPGAGPEGEDHGRHRRGQADSGPVRQEVDSQPRSIPVPGVPGLQEDQGSPSEALRPSPPRRRPAPRSDSDRGEDCRNRRPSPTTAASAKITTPDAAAAMIAGDPVGDSSTSSPPTSSAARPKTNPNSLKLAGSEAAPLATSSNTILQSALRTTVSAVHVPSPAAVNGTVIGSSPGRTRWATTGPSDPARRVVICSSISESEGSDRPSADDASNEAVAVPAAKRSAASNRASVCMLSMAGAESSSERYRG